MTNTSKCGTGFEIGPWTEAGVARSTAALNRLLVEDGLQGAALRMEGTTRSGALGTEEKPL